MFPNSSLPNLLCFRWRVLRGFGLAIAIAVVFSTSAIAEDKKTEDKKVGGGWKLELEGGGRTVFQYRLYTGIATPPPMIAYEGQLRLWLHEKIGFTFLYELPAQLASLTAYGFGIKVPFAKLNKHGHSYFEGLNLFFMLDYLSYTLDPATLPVAYAITDNIFRYGFSLNINITEPGVFLDLTVMATRMENNLFFAPFGGLGVHF